ncbi:MAG: DnaD domain protein [Bacilli bacterium]|nr:DnaD domain protein [Bacilli bacterium]
MANSPVLPADTYIVKNNTILSNENRNVLFKLYQPIIGSVAINLYLTLWSDLDSLNIISEENTHHNLMVKMRVKLEEIIASREKLEGIGLLKVYLKKDNVNNYIYELYSPLEPKLFLENPLLSVTLQNIIGKREYKKIIKFFSVPKVDLKEYKDITLSFSDTFDVDSSMMVSDNITNIRAVNQVDIIVSSKIDLNSVFSLIPEDFLNMKLVNKEVKSLIYKLAFIYNLNEVELAELIRNSADEKGAINKDLLRKNCSNYYTFEHSDRMPSLIYKNQPEYLRKKDGDASNRSKMIYIFETTSPYDFLVGRNKGIKPSKADLSLLETLLIDYELTPGVVNVLIDYVLKINNNKLTKNYCLAIAAQWKRSNIKTVEEAMKICIKENKSKKEVKAKKSIKKEVKPEWYDKKIEEDVASEEDIKKLEAMMNRK